MVALLWLWQQELRIHKQGCSEKEFAASRKYIYAWISVLLSSAALVQTGVDSEACTVWQVCWYNYSKIVAAQRAAALPEAKLAKAASAEAVQLLDRKKGASQV